MAVRPEAWRLVPGAADNGRPSAGSSDAAPAAAATGALAGQVLKAAYLGSHQELTVATALGEIFVIAPLGDAAWQAGDAVAMTLARPEVSVVEA